MSQDTGHDEMVASALAGDTDAIAELLVLHRPQLRRRLENRLRFNPYADFSAEDVLQECSIDVFRGIHTFRPEIGVPLVAWLNRVADNCLARFFRYREQQKREGSQQWIQTSDAAISRLMSELSDEEAITGSERLASKEIQEAILLCVASLSERERQAITSHYLHERSIESVAAEMSCSQNAVRNLLRRTRKKMRKLLEGSSRWFRKK